MKKIIPFKKDIIFKTNLSEITSISLEHTLHLESDNLIAGEFIISGEYKMADNSTNTDAFSFNLPFDISMDNKYILDNILLDIDDFYYEIINNNVLAVSIDVLIDKLEEKEIIEEQKIVIDNLTIDEDFENEQFDDKSNDIGVELEDLIERKEEIKVNEELPSMNRESLEVEEIKEEKNAKESVNIIKEDAETRSLFDSFDNSRETYTTYKIYIVRENDSLEIILQKYGVSKEDLEKYNDLKEIKIGDKLIIPSLVNEKN
jgi:LysM repeat protein